MRSILEHPVYADKKQQFIGHWLVRYGSDWVEINYETDIDEYFSHVRDQLLKMGKLEVQTTHSPASWNPVWRYRLIKDK
jgi:hypothetical protein